MENKKYYYIDIIRVLSMLFVVFLHVVSDILRINYNQAVWHFSNIISVICSTSVPLFFMISGALLLEKDSSKSVEVLFKKRLSKVIFPFLFWSLVAIFYLFCVGITKYHKVNFASVFFRLKSLMKQPVMIHFWFMYALIPIYCLLPFIKTVVDNANRSVIKYFFILWFIFSVLMPTCSNLVVKDYKMIFEMDLKYTLNIFNGYLGFFVLGYYLHIKDIKVKKIYLMPGILFEITFVGILTFVMTRKTGGYFEGLKTYCGIFTASLSVMLFLLIKELYKDKEKIKFKKTISFLCKYSFPVYLVHNIIINYMNINYYLVPNGSIGAIILRFSVVLLLSLAISFLLGAIKPLCFIATGNKYKGMMKKCEK